MVKQNVAFIVNNKLCVGCGICQDSCPKKCINIVHGSISIYPLIDDKLCIECGFCLKSCPGKGVLLKEESARLFKFKPDKYIGAYLNSYTGYSLDEKIRYHAASGGLITQFLIYLLDKKLIDGAVVTRFSDCNVMQSHTFIARNKEEIISAKSSKYCTTSIEGIMTEVKNRPGKYVVVGLPCHIQAYRLFSNTHVYAKECIIGYFAIYCSLNKINLSTEYYCYRYQVLYDTIKSFAYRDDGCMGYMKFITNDNKEKKIPYVHFWLGSHSFFINKRCLVCNDHFGELADISFGDINIPPYNEDKIGINSLVTRSIYWDAILQEANKDNYIHIDKLSKDILLKSQEYSRRHKKGKGIVAERRIRSFCGLKNPFHDDEELKPSINDFIKQIGAWCMIVIGKHRLFWPIIKYMDRYKD